MVSTSSPKASRRKRISWWQILLLLVFAILLIHTMMYYFFIPRKTPIFPDLKKPLNIAHQGGELLAPSNTMAAFDLAASLGVDMMETDIHMTKDGQLVLLHDETVDRTTNGKGRVDAFTLDELKKLDAGYNFQDLQGNYSYRGNGVTIPTLEELFVKYGERFFFTIEIKDAYPKEGASQIEAKLWELIQRYHMEKRMIVASFKQELLDHFASLAGNKVALSAGQAEATRFVLTHKFWVPGFYRPSANVLQIPTASSGFDLKDRNLIDSAHRLGMQIHYWTIDDKQTMQELILLGADGIITNRPDLLKEVLEEMRLK